MLLKKSAALAFSVERAVLYAVLRVLYSLALVL
jgi:hypothetical protein